MHIEEEVNEVAIKRLLDNIPTGLSALERVIIANYSTVQTLLSVVFHVPIEVEVLSQHNLRDVIVRWTRLVAKYSDDTVIPVCLAQSVIPKDNPEGFINGILEKKRGIGQILSSLRVNTKRIIIGMYADDKVFARSYLLCSDDINPSLTLIITELFLRDAFKKAEKVL